METEENKISLQAYERHGNFGVLWYGVDDSDESTWNKRIVVYRKPVTRSKREQRKEQQRMLQLGIEYENNHECLN